MDPPDRPDDKAAWRRQARTALAGIDQAAWSRGVIRALRAWLPFQQARCPAGFSALPSEPDLSELFTDGRDWCLPRTPADAAPLSFASHRAARVAHRHGMEEPHPNATPVPLAAIDLILVPGLAWDRFGMRLGRGAGYFDRTLALLAPSAWIVGVAHPQLLTSKLPSEPHDQPVHALALPDGVRIVAPPQGTQAG